MGEVDKLIENLQNDFFRKRMVQRVSWKLTIILLCWEEEPKARRAWAKSVILQGCGDDKELIRLVRRLK